MKGKDNTNFDRFFETVGSPRERLGAKKGVTVGQNKSSPSIITSTRSLSITSLSLNTGVQPNDSQMPIAFESEEISRKKRADAQFGPLNHPSHRYVSKHSGTSLANSTMDEPPYYYVLTTYISYLFLICLGHIRDFFGKRFSNDPKYKALKSINGYAPLMDGSESFYVRRLKTRIDDCFARPTTGVPGRYISLVDRTSDDYNLSYQLTGTYTETLNLSSYNYLGFAQSEGPCADAVEECVRQYGISFCSPRGDAGSSSLALEVEKEIAAFVGRPSAMIFSMGFVTNASSFPALVSKGCLIISDELNHASIRVGARLSGAVIRSFKHNDCADLETQLREAIAQGQPRTHRPWKKILVAIEGLYSMEGSICNLPGILKLKETYKFYLFVDEAHSIGALGPRGRGVCDYFNIDPNKVDILMGTFTKSFGANGGYIAGDRHVIAKLKSTNAATQLGESPTPLVLMQILASLKLIIGEVMPGQGEERLQRIAFNSRYLRLGLKRLGFIVYGDNDSPIIPVVVYNPAKMSAFSHEMLKRKISIVIVSYPATPLITSRVRFCVSSAHNKEDMDRVLAACDEVGDILQLKFSNGIADGQRLHNGVASENEAMWSEKNISSSEKPRWAFEDVIAHGVADAKAAFA